MANLLTRLEDIASTYATDNIFILGKGPSIDLVSPLAYANSLVIGINDAERIAPTDITIFSGSWVAQGLKESNFRSRLYITSVDDFDGHGKAVIHAPAVPLTQESSELLMQRLMTDELQIEGILFVTALKLARMIADIRKKRQTVYMLGFDFDADAGFSKSLNHDFAGGTQQDRSLKISIQEYYFLNCLYVLRDSQLNIQHVGSKPFSAVSPDVLNGLAPEEPRPSGGDHTTIVAELTTNHFGDRFRIEKMIRASKAAGADYIKLQKRDVETFYSADQLQSPYRSPYGKTFGDYRHQLELSRDDFEFVGKLCSELDIGWFASVLDKPSFDFVLELGVPIIKLPSTISDHRDYLQFVAERYDGEIVLSTGMTDEEYEAFILQTFQRSSKIYLLQCNSAYPTPSEDCHVAVIRKYRELALSNSRIVPGYSSHDLGWKASVLAVAAGARMVEKHVKLGNAEWAHFDAVAVDLTTPAFKDYVDHIREAELMLGSEVKKINASEHHKYRR